MKPIIIGTRGSELALAQAEMTELALRCHFPNRQINRKIITTTGDRRTDVPLSQLAKAEGVLDKGVFTKELEIALENGEIDLAVHSMKDVPTVLAEHFEIAGVLERAASADVLVCSEADSLDALAEGATVATSSVRRQRQLQWLRPDLKLVDIRGNVPTRLEKLRGDDGLDAIMLAKAGLVRLGYDLSVKLSGGLHAITLDVDNFLPAAGQGIVGFEVRSDDDDIRAAVGKICHAPSMLLCRAEREFLRLLNAGCDTPVGVRSRIDGDKLHMASLVFGDDIVVEPASSGVVGLASEPEQVAAELFKKLV